MRRSWDGRERKRAPLGSGSRRTWVRSGFESDRLRSQVWSRTEEGRSWRSFPALFPFSSANRSEALDKLMRSSVDRVHVVLLCALRLFRVREVRVVRSSRSRSLGFASFVVSSQWWQCRRGKAAVTGSSWRSSPSCWRSPRRRRPDEGLRCVIASRSPRQQRSDGLVAGNQGAVGHRHGHSRSLKQPHKRQ